MEFLSLEILNNPIFTTVQDLGRVGFMHTGLSSSGANDEFLYLLGNKLLQNDKNTSCTVGENRVFLLTYVVIYNN